MNYISWFTKSTAIFLFCFYLLISVYRITILLIYFGDYFVDLYTLGSIACQEVEQGKNIDILSYFVPHNPSYRKCEPI